MDATEWRSAAVMDMRDLSELNINERGRPVVRPAPSDATIDAFQHRFGLVLPAEYLTLLRFANGGHPELDSIEPAGRPGASRHAVNRFYHLSEDTDSASSLWAAMEAWRPILGVSALPFASDSGGNQFFLDVDTHPASVKLCLHDEDFRVVDIASSFDVFINRLSTDPDMI